MAGITQQLLYGGDYPSVVSVQLLYGGDYPSVVSVQLLMVGKSENWCMMHNSPNCNHTYIIVKTLTIDHPQNFDEQTL